MGRVESNHGPATRFETGVVAGVLDAVLSGRPDEGWVPRYDVAYVDWQIGRCPALECATIWTDALESKTAAVLWRARGGTRWRVAIWAQPDHPAHARSVLIEAVRRAGEQGGHQLSAVVAETDGQTQALLADAGFRRSDLVFPLYVLAGSTGTAVEGLGYQCYLDSDLAYRF